MKSRRIGIRSVPRRLLPDGFSFPLAESLSALFEVKWESLSDDLRTWMQTNCPLTPVWNEIGTDTRRAWAAQYDLQHDPAQLDASRADWEKQGKVHELTDEQEKVAKFQEKTTQGHIAQREELARIGAQLLALHADEPPCESTPAVPISHAAVQDAAVLDCLKQLGHDPKQLLRNKPGKPGVKAEVRAALGTKGIWEKTTVFKSTWERLSTNKDILYKKG